VYPVGIAEGSPPLSLATSGKEQHMGKSMTREKVALVTGVSSGIGRATATLLSERGFRVFGTMRRPGQTNAALQNVEVIRLDVCDEESARSCLRTVLDRAGRIDALVNNAGHSLIGSSEETSIEEAKELFETNFFGTLRMIQAVLPTMREQRSGRIVNISSVVGFLPAPYMGIYAASKHALEGYSESLDHEVRQFGIRVCVVEPGFTRTNLDQNGHLAGQLLEAYGRERDRAREAVRVSIARGENPARVALVVSEALKSRSPRRRYPAGRAAKILTLLKKLAPAQLLDRGIRKQFGLGGGEERSKCGPQRRADVQ
jgi:NAD(P)-dependent dehydrogenase (short-subunit alcohol dehydrogenase family)